MYSAYTRGAWAVKWAVRYEIGPTASGTWLGQAEVSPDPKPSAKMKEGGDGNAAAPGVTSSPSKEARR